MSELNFACPLCAQSIECGGEWVGQQIQCPICQGAIVVPSAPAPPPPPARSGARLAATTPAERAAPALPSVMAGAELKLAASLAQAKHDKIKRIAMIAAGVVILGVGCYFGIPAIMKWQTQFNLAQKKDLENADGGQVSHIVELNNVLDATEPGRMQSVPEPARAKPRKSATTGPASNAPQPDASTTATNEPPAPPPEWTLDVEAMKIPKSKANGWLAGTNFTPDNAFLDISGSRHTLTLRQGTNFYADRELVIFLRLKTGQAITNSVWTVAKDERTGVPSVVKRSKTNPRSAPQAKSFANGYAMKLEFGKSADGIIPGKIYAALPDPEQSVVAGRFNAKIRVVNPVPVAVPGRPIAPSPYRR